jgi:hypothetical protein
MKLSVPKEAYLGSNAYAQLLADVNSQGSFQHYATATGKCYSYEVFLKDE